MRYGNGYEISAVKDDGECVTVCEDNDPGRIAFGLYRIDRQDLARWVSDHPTREAAEIRMRQLLAAK